MKNGVFTTFMSVVSSIFCRRGSPSIDTSMAGCVTNKIFGGSVFKFSAAACSFSTRASMVTN